MPWNNTQEETAPTERPQREATPDMFAGLMDEPLPQATGPDSAWTASCYICARVLTGLPEGYEQHIDRRLYEYFEGDQRRKGRRHSYVISFCWTCKHLVPPR